MQFTTAFAACFATFITVAPVVMSNPLRGLLKRDTVHCGTTADAIFSDCRSLINNQSNWDAAFLGGNNTVAVCQYTNFIPILLEFKPAFKTACLGKCCVYYASGKVGSTTTDTLDSNKIRTRAIGLLGCANAGNNFVNGLGVASDGSGVCISDGTGCSDCFDDSDFQLA